jgi:aminoglycoside phosphotransferase (APT) family kinase protein
MSSEPVGLDRPAIEAFLTASRPDLPPPFDYRLFASGRSNLTFVVTASDGQRFVLRRPPLGLVAPSANDLAREHRVLRALSGSEVPVPTPLAFNGDPSVGGAPFLVMSFVEGASLDSAASGAALAPATARAAAEALVDALVAIHATDLDRTGLHDFARHGGYLSRQVQRWHGQWEIVRTRELAGVDELHARLVRDAPEQDSAVTLVHGDFRFDNTLHAIGDPTTIVAVLDWEMATLGDPLADLGLLMAYWSDLAAPLLQGGNPVTANPGFPSQEEVAGLYQDRTGADLGSFGFYRALAFLKLAVITEGLHRRHHDGATFGAGFDAMGDLVPALVEAGLEQLAAATRPEARRT